MPGNAFIRFKKGSTHIEGESKQKGQLGKEGWIEIGDWSWEVTADSNFMKGGGSSVGKATPGNLSFSQYFNRASKGLYSNIVKGTHFDEVELVMLKQTGEATPKVYFSLKAKEAFTTKVAVSGGEDGAVSQDVEVTFKSVTVEYFTQSNDGTLKTTNAWTWDIAAQELTGG